MSSLALYILLITIKVITVIVLGTFCLFIGIRLWFEPIKGVCKAKTKLHGKVVLITGGNSGIGLETAKDLAKRGARVIIASRNDEKSAEAVEQIKQFSKSEKVEYRHLNLADMKSVREFANNFNKDYDRLEILVNNAGSGAVKNKITTDKIDLLMAINYVGPFLLTYLLLDKLKASKPSRIVIVSSEMHLFSKFCLEDLTKLNTRTAFFRYANTKFCDVLWTKELSRRLPQGVTVNAVHPGFVNTSIFETLYVFLKKPLYLMVNLLFKTQEEGAQPVIYLCVAPEVENMSGGYYKDCFEAQASKKCEDDNLAKALWDKTLTLVKN